jgi:mono/diheme cytochrome c family protein
MVAPSFIGADVEPASDATAKGDGDRGRLIFNGKGICFYCHGQDGDLNQRPRLAPDLAGIIARLDPQPTDLRQPRGLKLTSDRERVRAIREGHAGTGMFPDAQLTDEEIVHLLAYLAVPRREAPAHKRVGP